MVADELVIQFQIPRPRESESQKIQFLQHTMLTEDIKAKWWVRTLDCQVEVSVLPLSGCVT